MLSCPSSSSSAGAWIDIYLDSCPTVAAAAAAAAAAQIAIYSESCPATAAAAAVNVAYKVGWGNGLIILIQ